MPLYTLDEVSRIVGGSLSGNGNLSVKYLVYDSRRLQHPESSLFFALKTLHADGHQFIKEAYKKGVKSFVVSEMVEVPNDANVIMVYDALSALQALCAHHRREFEIPVIGVTGSNGKTIVKE